MKSSTKHIAVVLAPSQDYAIFVRQEPHMTDDGLFDPELEEWKFLLDEGDMAEFDFADYAEEPDLEAF